MKRRPTVAEHRKELFLALQNNQCLVKRVEAKLTKQNVSSELLNSYKETFAIINHWLNKSKPEIIKIWKSETYPFTHRHGWELYNIQMEIRHRFKDLSEMIDQGKFFNIFNKEPNHEH